MRLFKVCFWASLLAFTVIVILLHFLVRLGWAEEPIRSYPETTWCGGVQLVTEYPGPQYVVQRLGDCPTLWIDGSVTFQMRVYYLLEKLHHSQPEVTDRLLAVTWHIVEGLPFGGISPGIPKGAIFWQPRLCEGIGGDAWCVSILAAHEPKHLEQFIEGRPWCGPEAEREANNYQADVLERLTAGDTDWRWRYLVGELRQVNHGDWSGYPDCT